MASNFPGPYQIRINYTVASRPHQQRLNCQVVGTPEVGADPATITLINRGNSMNPFMDDAVNNWASLMSAVYDDTLAAWSNAELWKYEAGTFDASYVTTHPITETGLDTGTVNTAAQHIITFRTGAGGILRLDFMETNLTAPQVPDTPPFTSSGLEAIRQLLISDANWVYARDNSYPVAAIAMYAGHNEALIKKIYRP